MRHLPVLSVVLALGLYSWPIERAHAQCAGEKIAAPSWVDGRDLALDSERLYIGYIIEPPSGGVRVFRRTSSGWALEAMLAPADPLFNQWFGRAVQVWEHRLIASAHLDSQLGQSAGAAYVFRRDGQTWQQEAKLLAPDGGPTSWLGHSVALSETHAAAGAPLHANFTGAMYLFRRDGTEWVFEQKLDPPPGAGSQFGRDGLALRGETLFVGSYGAAGGLTKAGTVFVYQRVSGVWSLAGEVHPIVPINDSRFGWSLAVWGDVLVVGAMSEFVSLSAAYIFRETAPGQWHQEAKIDPPALAAPSFAISVAAAPGLALIGAPAHPTGLPCTGSGVLYAFQNGAWHHKATLSSLGNGNQCNLGSAVALWGNAAALSAPKDTAPGFGGSVFVFDDLYDCWCYADCDNSGGWGQLSIDDFICFQLKFALGDPYANCDGNTNPDGSPILDIDDFICFQLKFALGTLCF